MTRDRGSTAPLLIGFVVIALLLAAGAVSVGEAFVQQRGLQSVCDGVAVAAATAVNLSRDATLADAGSARLAGADQAVHDYLARDAQRRDVQATVSLSADARRVDLECHETAQVAFGGAFGKRNGVRHTARSSARAGLAP